MATVRREIVTRAHPDQVWQAVRDIGALHTRLVPGFVVDTTVDGADSAVPVRTVTFGNGAVIREPIVTLDDEGRRLVWSAEGGITTHYNASAEVLPEGDGARVIWLADFLPAEAERTVAAMMDAGAAAMKAALDELSGVQD